VNGGRRRSRKKTTRSNRRIHPVFRLTLSIWPQFSEFSFGYAFTDNLVNKVLSGINGVPVFPSLQEEGNPGIGYDVKIPRRSAPLFLQFKLPQIVRRHRNVWEHDLSAPYYRIHLMRRSHSSQHASLLRHARRGKMVFYVAPEFDRRDELNDFYQKGLVPIRSAFFDPKDIGQIDDSPHHVAYRQGLGVAWLCSRARRLTRHTGAEVLLADLQKAVAEAPILDDRKLFFHRLADEIIETALKTEVEEEAHDTEPITPSFPTLRDPDAEQRRLAPFRDRLGPGRFAAFVSHLYLDCQLIIVGRDN
jgi:hypothetical protein